MNTINNSINPNFKGVCIQRSLMTRAQHGRAFALAEKLPSSKFYEKFVDEGKDIFIFAGKSANNLLVRIMDKYSGEWYRNPVNNKIAEMKVAVERGLSRDWADEILEFFNGVCTQKPEENALKIFKGKTPLMKLMPDAEEKVAEMADYVKSIQDYFSTEKGAIEHVVDIFKYNDVPEKGFEFDF